MGTKVDFENRGCNYLEKGSMKCCAWFQVVTDHSIKINCYSFGNTASLAFLSPLVPSRLKFACGAPHALYSSAVEKKNMVYPLHSNQEAILRWHKSGRCISTLKVVILSFENNW